MPPQKLAGIGIDIISLERAGGVLTRHRRMVRQRFFSKNERKQTEARCLNGRRFSKVFAAKEAVFKACRGAWLGFDGFSSIEIVLQPRGRFTAKLNKRFSRSGSVQGFFIMASYYTVAFTILFNK